MIECAQEWRRFHRDDTDCVAKVLLLDNRDSFTFNVAHLLGSVEGCDVTVSSTDFSNVDDLELSKYDGVVISPGPGHPAVPRDFRVCREVILESSVPVLGICLGHQGIAHYMGGSVGRAYKPVHGRASSIHHNGNGLFQGIPSPFKAVRYHSLIVSSKLPPEIEVCAWTEQAEVMAIEHRGRPLRGIQFHPESICTEFGDAIARNFRDWVLRWKEEQARSGSAAHMA